MYLMLKHSHLLVVVISFVLFCLRYGLRQALPDKSLPRWLKWVPHLNDTVVLMTGLGLIYVTGWRPFGNAPWLGIKLLLLLFYIGWGTVALKSPPRSGKSAFAGLMAWLCIVGMALLALNKPVLW